MLKSIGYFALLIHFQIHYSTFSETFEEAEANNSFLRTNSRQIRFPTILFLLNTRFCYRYLRELA